MTFVGVCITKHYDPAKRDWYTGTKNTFRSPFCANRDWYTGTLVQIKRTGQGIEDASSSGSFWKADAADEVPVTRVGFDIVEAAVFKIDQVVVMLVKRFV